MRAKFTIFFLFFAVSLCAQTRYLERSFTAADVDSDLVYVSETCPDSTGDIDFEAHVWEPQGDSETSRPTILFFHGGGWVGGNAARGDDICEELAEFGYVAVSATYCLSGQENGYEESTRDMLSLISWIKDNRVTYGVDTTKIVVAGESAGGSTALFVAFHPTVSGGNETVLAGTTTDFTQLVLNVSGSLVAHDTSPVTHWNFADEVDYEEGEVWWLMGDADSIWPPAQQDTAFWAVRDNDIGDRTIIPGDRHAIVDMPGQEEWTAAQMARFIYRRLFDDDVSLDIRRTKLLDDFNRTNEGPPPSASWGNTFNGLEVNGNEVAGDASGANISYWDSDFEDDQEVFVTIKTKTANNDAMRLYVRMQDYTGTGVDGYALKLLPKSGIDEVCIEEVANGGFTQIGQCNNYELQVDQTWRFRAVGDSLIAILDNSYWLSQSDATYTFGRIGLQINNTAGRCDDFGGGSLKSTRISQ